MVAFTPGSYLWMPRPVTDLDELQLSACEGEYIAQFKLNGEGAYREITPDRRVIAWNRHRQKHKLWNPSVHTSDAFHHLKGGSYAFWAELLHTKVSNAPKDINYINDIAVCDNELLVGTTFGERQKLLETLFDVRRLPVSQSGGYWIIDAHTWLARPQTGFLKVFRGLAGRAGYPSIREPAAEGLVLKRADAKLAFPGNERANVSWLLKCKFARK